MTRTLTLRRAAADTVADMARPPVRALLAVLAVFGAIVAVAAASASAQVLPGGQVPIKVFHSRTGAAAVLVPISIGRGHGYFILDTGAEKSMIDQRIARELGLRPVGRKHILCGITGCNRPMRSVGVPGWHLGNVALPATNLAQGNLLTLFPGPTLAAGLLGADVLSAYGKINIDFANSLLTLGDGNPIAPSPPPSEPAPPSTPATPGSGLIAK
jgi:Aspartyl protease